jgi:hypothetical protein
VIHFSRGRLRGLDLRRAIAEVYDEWYLQRMDPPDAIEILAGFAADGRALEL